jgi:benzoylformate decarboxylase
MRAKQVFMDSLIAQGVDHIFGNPGTTESPIIDALVDHPEIRYVVALHEGVAVGAASYYAHASGGVGVVNLHVAPGLGNAIGMIYDAAKANAPLVVTAGQQDTRLRLREPVLGHDLAAMAAPVTKWSVQAERADEMALLLHRAFKVATDPPAGPVFVALPIDVMEQETANGALAPSGLYRAPAPDAAGVDEAARLLLGSRNPAIVVADVGPRAAAQAELVALAELTGAGVWYEGIHMGITFPTSHPSWRGRLGFDAAAVRRALDGVDAVVLVGGSFFEEVWFETGASFPAGTTVIQVVDAPERLARNFAVRVGLVADTAHGLRAIRQAVEAGAGPADRAVAAKRAADLVTLKEKETESQKARAQRRWDREPLSMPRVMAELAGALPPDGIVVDEAITAGPDLARTIAFARPGDYWGARGGGIGQALPGAIGVKLAHPDRPVVAVSGDGSAMYSIQALWTAAHHDLAVVFVILSNREYRILKHNMDTYRQRFGVRAERPYLHMDLDKPTLGFTEMAQGMGVTGVRASSAAELRAALDSGFRSKRPVLIDVAVEGRG